ncbi:PHD finger protein 20-like protein 1 [Centruroides vittatus]|uniref:PHD finger protein 20-like protein 1 n=1 Tax=Centruroides vittatus TaxID=120091 RepID=UPI00350FBA8E
MGPRHKLTNRDIAKLLKKKRDMRKREASGNHDDEQHGMKKKRIPNRPGITFQVGARLEAKDYLDKWYTSKIVAVDEEEAEILIHFERWSARFDEWMPMDSPRIRALTHPSTRNEQKEKVKVNKSLLQYKVGEEVLARWTDCKMYPARILQLNEDGLYDVLFYDGFRRALQPLNIEKLPKEMVGKVDIPTIPKEEKCEKKTISTKEFGKSPKRMKKGLKSNKLIEKDLKWILGKRKKLIVGGIFQAKRIKLEEEKRPITPRKTKGRKQSMVPEEETVKPNSELLDEVAAPVGYIDGRKIARKEFIIEEDHNHFKCKVPGCNKSFRKDKLLQSHMKHYHNNSDTKVKEKHNTSSNNSSIEETKEIPIKEIVPVQTNEKSIEEETDEKLQTPKKQELTKSSAKELQTPSPKVPKDESKSNCNQENTKTKGSKAVKAEVTNCKQSNIEDKVSEDKPIKTENKPVKTENKSTKIDKNKPSKSENKSSKTEKGKTKVENKPIKIEKDEKIPENSEYIQEVKKPEEINVLKIEQEKKVDESVTIKIEEKPLTSPPPEKPHTGRSKKRRTLSLPLPEGNIIENTPVNDSGNDIKTINEIPDITKSEDKFNSEKSSEFDIKTTPDSKHLIQEEETEEGQSDEIVHCVCNCIEENGLMMQCEVCLTWQHGACFEIDDVKDVPDKYVCYACLKPKGLRESFRYKHDQDWFKKGELTTFGFLSNKIISNTDTQTSLVIHELVSSLHNILFVIHSLQCKLKIAKEENHPDLNLWKTPWLESSQSLFSEDADLNQMQITRVADFDHSYSSLKQDLETANAANKLNDHWKSEEKDWFIENKKKPEQNIVTVGETSHTIEQQKLNGRSISNDREKTNIKSFNKKEEKFNILPDPIHCKKNLLDHIIYMQHNIEQQLNAIEDHLQMLETEMGSSHIDVDKQMPKLLNSVRKLMKDLALVQQLTQFQ